MRHLIWYSLLLLLLLLGTSSLHAMNVDGYRTQQSQCIPIRKDTLCSKFRYKLTKMPNILGYENQDEAHDRLKEFLPLIEYNCSSQLLFFLCSLLFPMCSPKVKVGIPACRPMCETVRDDCEPIMKTFGHSWSINCSKLPMPNEEHRLCMHDNRETESAIDPVDPAWTVESEMSMNSQNDLSYNLNPWKDPFVDETEVGNYDYIDPNKKNWLYDDDTYDNGMDTENVVYSTSLANSDESAPENHQNPGLFPEIDKQNYCRNPAKFVFMKKKQKCIPRCGQNMDIFFSSKDKKIVHIFFSVCASLCFLSTAFTVSSFAIASERFKYPERPIVFLAICYNLYSVGYLLQSWRGSAAPLSCVHNSTLEANHLAADGIASTGCLANFFILYYFGMAGSTWWVVLSIAWFLSAGCKWGSEAIEKYSFYYHVIAWVLPAIQTVVAMAMGNIDGDELTGICFIGNLHSQSLMYYVIIPHTFYFLIGSVTLVFGFTCLFKIRRAVKQSSQATSDLEKLMMKMGVFSLLYTVPAACIIAVDFYQYDNLSRWIDQSVSFKCNHRPSLSNLHIRHETWSSEKNIHQDYLEAWNTKNEEYPARNGVFDATTQQGIDNMAKTSIPRPTSFDCHLAESIPPLAAFCIRIFMSLVVGITSGMWVWSKKTISAWRKLIVSSRCRGRGETDHVVTGHSCRLEPHLISQQQNTIFTEGNPHELYYLISDFKTAPTRPIVFKQKTRLSSYKYSSVDDVIGPASTLNLASETKQSYDIIERNNMIPVLVDNRSDYVTHGYYSNKTLYRLSRNSIENCLASSKRPISNCSLGNPQTCHKFYSVQRG